MSKILITGATGQLGKEVVNLLLQKIDSSNIYALVRDLEKAKDLISKGVSARVGNYDDYTSLVNAFKGIDKLYFISGSDIITRTEQHKRVVKAAKEADVKHIIYTSFQRKNETADSPIATVAESHLKTEECLVNSGIGYTILKHGLYMDMLPIFIGENIFDTKIIYQPAGEGKTSYILRKDLAELGAIILSTNGHENKIYDAMSNNAVTYTEVAKILSDITGKFITYVSPTQEEFIKTLTGAGVPIGFVELFAGFAEAIKQGEFEETNNTIETLLGRKTISVNQYLTEVYSKN